MVQNENNGFQLNSGFKNGALHQKQRKVRILQLYKYIKIYIPKLDHLV